MANTNSPQFQTYKTEIVKFDDTATYRSGNLTTTQRDSAIVNLFYDRVSQENKTRDVSLKKRPGLAATDYSLNKADSTSVIRGYYYDIQSNRFYWGVENHVYYLAPDGGSSVTLVTTLTTSSGYIGFCEFLRASDSKRFIVFSDGIELWLDEIGGTATKVTDADLPSPHIPTPVQLDGYLFVAEANTNDIYNCVNDNPFSWEPGDYISAEMSGDYVTRLANNRNYIVALGSGSIEVFWNAAEASGSPMKRNESGFKTIGYVSGLVQIGDLLFFVGQDKNKQLAVYRMDGFKVERISDEIVDRTLQPIVGTTNERSGVFLSKEGYSCSIDGHTFYVLPSTQTTWVFDIDEKLWYEWKNSSDTGLAVQAAWTMFNGQQYVAIAGQTYISKMSPNIFQDFGVNFKAKYVTQDLTFGTSNFKSCSRLYIDCDQHLNTGSSSLNVYWSDSDYVSGSEMGPYTVNIFSNSPYITRLGRFRRRSFRLEYSDNYPLRLKQMSLDINVGTA